MPGLVAVTGATGFIGQHLIDALLEQGWYVRALARSRRQDSGNLQWVSGDLDSTSSLDELIDGVEFVIHCAGRVRGRSYQQFEDTNVRGTENVLASVMKQVKLPKFLLVSSLAAREPHLSWYANSKFQSERLLTDVGDKLQWSILRPTAVYGPGDREMAPLFNATRWGILPAAGGNQSRFSLIYVEDLVKAIVYWMKFCNSYHRIYELDDGTSEGYDLEKVKDTAATVWGRPVFKFSLPPVIIRGVAEINLGLSRIFRYSPMLTPGKARELLHHDWVCNNMEFTRDTGWKPEVTLHGGLTRTVRKK